MNRKLILALTIVAGVFEYSVTSEAAEKPAAPVPDATVDASEVKVKIEQTPGPVHKVIKKQLATGDKLEDISKQTGGGKTVYEVDFYRKEGGKLEVRIAKDGKVLSRIKEGADEADGAVDTKNSGWRDEFKIDKSKLMPTGKNPYLTIEPGRVQKLKKSIDTLTIKVLPDTITVDGVKCGILEERETEHGKLIEVSRNFFATDPDTGDVYYFGEDVDNYKDGKIIDHESAWHAGEKDARFGLMVPGKPKVENKYYQEIAPKVALDRVEIVSTDEMVKVPAGTFEHCLHLKETTPLEADVSHKWYAPGVGMIKDDDFELAEKP